MSQPSITCSCCKGKGHRNLPDKLKASYYEAKKLDDFKVVQFAFVSNLELTHAHKRVQRLVHLGFLKRVNGNKVPAVYRAVVL